MKILSVSFNYGNNKVYDTLATVLEKSIHKNCPKADFTLLRLDPPKITHDKKCFDTNHYKLKYWLDFVMSANDDVVVLDCDMLALRDLSQAFDSNFDIGLCERNHKGLVWNGGAVFIRNTERARTFMNEWYKADSKLFSNKELHNQWRIKHKFGGMNQASLGYLLHSMDKNSVTIKRFPCEIWNSTVEYWQRVSDKTMILHVKGAMRKNLEIGGMKWPVASKMWYDIAAECGIRDASGGKLTTAIYKYKDYNEYIKAQRSTTEKKSDLVWVNKNAIGFLARAITKRGQPLFGICHGTRGGAEQKVFMTMFPKCKVIGTEIAEIAKTAENTIEWDFNKSNPEWIGKADFVYSNAFDHCYDPEETIKTWLAQLKKKGVLIIEHSSKHEKPPSISDPFSFSAQTLAQLVKVWTNGRYRVSSIISPPNLSSKSTRKTFKYDIRFILIERTPSDAETFAEARKKALG